MEDIECLAVFQTLTCLFPLHLIFLSWFVISMHMNLLYRYARSASCFITVYFLCVCVHVDIQCIYIYIYIYIYSPVQLLNNANI